MRTTYWLLTGALVLASSGTAFAQTISPTAPLPASPALGQVTFGFRSDSVSGDEARYSRFRDLRQGPFADAFRLEKETPGWLFTAAASNVGYRDQRYTGTVARIGRFSLNVDWNQVPLFISTDTRSLYADRGNGVLAIDDAIQQGVQSGTLALSSALAQATRYDLRSRRDVGNVDLVYRASREVDLKFRVRNSTREGSNLMSFGFGTSPGLNPVVELAVPMDDRTTDVKGTVEFANRRGMVAVGYDASWYENHLPLVRFDNPLRATDISAGPSAGQAVLWPANTSAAFNLTGAYNLPARSRATAAISVGRWSQDQALAPPTVNTALVAPPLERASAQGKADIVSMVYGFNSRPLRNLSLNGRYRYYDYDNGTPAFRTTALVGDWALGTATRENATFSLNRNTLDLDASYTPIDHLVVGAGYGREVSDRTHRIYEETAEDVVRLSVDSRGSQYFTAGLKFERSNREGSGFDEASLTAVNEQTALRHYDVADRERSRLQAIVTVTPTPLLAFNATAGAGDDDYQGGGFGLRDSTSRRWSAGVDLVPSDVVSLGVNYGYEKFTANQASRTSNPRPSPQFDDPTRDWWADQDDVVKTLTARLDLLNALPKTTIKLGYDLSDGKATYVYSLRPDQTVFTTTPLAQLPPLKNRLSLGTVDVRRFLRPNVAVGVTYWYEDYEVDDFSQNSGVINQLNLPSAIYSGYLLRGYTSHTAWLGLTYLW